MPFTSALPLSPVFEFLTFGSQERSPPHTQIGSYAAGGQAGIFGGERALSLDPRLHCH